MNVNMQTTLTPEGTLRVTGVDTQEFPNNYYISPFADFMVYGLVTDWCKANPIPEPFDENDSWHWNIRSMHEFKAALAVRCEPKSKEG